MMARRPILLLAAVLLAGFSMIGCDLRRPEIPDMERIQADLIGQSMTNWKFDSMREFESFEIEETSDFAQIVEYQVRMRLRSIGADAFTAEARAVVAYRLENGHWELVSVSETGFEPVTPRS